MEGGGSAWVAVEMDSEGSVPELVIEQCMFIVYLVECVHLIRACTVTTVHGNVTVLAVHEACGLKQKINK